ncbi:potassium-transporting ATPase subunit A [Anabaena cylindrica FACHB-243]|uniref:Potassium-transporting ATPase potassium-binding subunit n=1 Tax=Anabaena cylindrica (strain ATCC 27899 / PCC 7122) TaxID=272123 RepID=K9ZHJ9_ANACC|nr:MULTISPECIES: potassium-transporting ATPase subunit KdpA [Anabaena]AFZ58708.1 Potassium-transporting ATPase A chain [Anabaena cylindrica PCC 7122]MBD2420051.1 potassium-transporting ATPase subunit A [Anabaena cylindrica FACHB-243]MBY5282978.1 potassium-transporting ATPase subunit A [Anabaena sp. CCAP 1446/1C]MBY5306523.1 potassium-transporting ATPase subunit A [Anabaena sp. CCAP 1446/1C]MCM2407053.1 potassium-transporting ATPase subunit KdpA [Anabaena sp. CCAP 1446/1C]
MLQGWIQIALTLLIVIATTPLLGKYIARVFLGEKTLLDKVLNPLEKVIYTFSGVRPDDEMTGWQYIQAVLYSNLVMGILVYLILMLQGWLPLNPTGLSAPNWHLALHTTLSFLTNTDQQHYAGETTYSYASQTFALGFLMFTSAATGIAVGIAFIRGLTGRTLGNFYIDLTKSITRILLPMSVVGGLLLMMAGVPETLAGVATATTLEGTTQAIARGPIAHFEIIKQIGENGGGFFGINSAHPYENPNGFTNLLETWAMISIPSAFIYTYGVFANNIKQAWLVFWMVFIIFVILVGVAAIGEYQGNPLVNNLLGEQQPNLEGKEVRFGWAQTALWAVMTTATMCGAVNGMHDSLMPPGGFATLFNLFLQIIWGGQGTGTAYLFLYLILAVFLTGLMVGRTPEFLGRKIEKKEIVLASVVLLIHPFAILIPWSIVFAFPDALGGITNPGFHGVSQVVYEYASAAANNGSGFEGLGDGTLWWNLSTSISILAGRYISIIALLLLADSMSRKQLVPISAGTLRTDTKLFTGITGGVILILGALTFFPVLVLGPIAEAFLINRGG